MQSYKMNATLLHSISDIWHSVPRVDLTFNVVNSTFKPDNEDYRQSLVMWGLVPVFILFITLLGFLIYFCQRCCRNKDENAEIGHPRYFRVSATVLAILSLLVICVGFYGNREAEKGLESVMHGTDGVISAVRSVQTEVEVANKSIESIRHAIESHPQRNTDISNLFQHSGSFLESFHLLSEQLNRANISTASQHLRDLVDLAGYRWLTVVLLMTSSLTLSLTLLFGIAKSSQYTLILFSVCSTIEVMLCWIFAGIHLTSCMAVGDFCVTSDNPLEGSWPTLADDDEIVLRNRLNQVTTRRPLPSVHIPEEGVSDSAILSDYISCDTTSTPNPFKQPLLDAMVALQKSRSRVEEIDQFVRDEETWQTVNTISKNIDMIWNAFTKLTALTDCNSMHREYTDGVNSLCQRALPGLSLVFLCTSIIAITFSCLIILSSFLWRHYSGQQKSQWQHATLTVETPSVADTEGDDAVFMSASVSFDDPRSDYRRIALGSNNNNRNSLCSSNRRRQQREMPLLPRHHLTPPPAYNSDEFYRQYSDVSPSIYGILDSTTEA